jgi:cytochrome c oxidase assembly factor CtaG
MAIAAVIAAYAIPYTLRARTLARRGRPVAGWRIWCFGAGLAVLAAAISPPFLELAGSRFAAHMAEHLPTSPRCCSCSGCRAPCSRRCCARPRSAGCAR